MFRFFTQISDMAHRAVLQYCPQGALAIDATLGNGLDTDFLLDHFERVVAFDIQKQAIDDYPQKDNSRLRLIADSHHRMSDYVLEPVDCVMFNLGYLPGSDHEKITRPETSTDAILQGLSLLRPGGFMTIASYIGHDGGASERDAVLEVLRSLPKRNLPLWSRPTLIGTSWPPFW